jgi:protein-disulfide isomerase
MEQQQSQFESGNQTKQKDYILPLSIVLSSLLIAGSVIYSAGINQKNVLRVDNKQSTTTIVANKNIVSNGNVIEIQPVTKEDYIMGPVEAPIIIVEFSDLECPFCKMFHMTMKQIMEEYNAIGKVAWVYRHYPIDELHPKARKEAEALECVGEIGGNKKFWEYLDKIFMATPSNNRLDLNQLPIFASSIGIERSSFEKCLESGKYRDKINRHIEDAQRSGALGTPYSVILTKDGRKYPIKGALPFDAVKSLIDQVLQEVR